MRTLTNRLSASPWLRIAAMVGTASVATIALASCSPGEEPSDVKGTTPQVVTGDQAPAGEATAPSNSGGHAGAVATLIDTKNKTVGRAVFSSAGSSVKVTVTVNEGIAAGFHGMHLHSNGVCDPSTSEPFTSAGGHLQVPGHTGHPSSGDLVSINVLANGSGSTVTTTDAVKIDQIVGKSIVIHEKPDNFANIPNRYSPPADEKTMTTGDAGARLACGVISAQE